MDQVISKHKAIHPGAYVKQNIIPKGMTVTKAAKLLGVGRPALSNFLNGNADLSPEMALRLERTFLADSETLIELQARFDLIEETMEKESVVSGVYAPELAEINAVDIQRWAEENIRARQELSALLRRLVHSTGRELTHVDFPAYDNAEDRGLDGTIETAIPTPWIPGGKSGWQLTCRADIGKKAEDDYARGMKLVPKQEWSKTTFVFVVARNWRRKLKWAKEKTEIGHWKDVRAYDAGDLEQWLEQSAPAQVWFAERLGKLTAGFRSIEQCWREWSDVCKQPLSPQLFDSSVELHAENFKDWLAKEPVDPFVVAADSREEALAFLRCMARSCDTNDPRPDHRMVVFDTPEVLQHVTSGVRLPFVAVISTTKAEKKIAGLYRRCHCVIIRPSNSEYDDPDIVLDRLDFLDFHKALESMGYTYNEIVRLARKSGCSLTILRRCLSNIPEVKKPSWAGDAEIARKLIPATMVGAWNSAAPGDRAAVQRLSRRDDYTILEENVAELLKLKDAPLWSAGDCRGVVSRIDALFGIASFVTKTDLDNFLAVAKDVLCENDTATNMTPEYGLLAKPPQSAPSYSEALRRGIRETLILLAVYGNRLFYKGLGFDAEAEVAAFVKELLIPFNQDRILSCGTALPDFAEAAPEVVLSLIETDLRKREPVICELMKTPGHSILSHPIRTPFLWALQVLAWNSRRFPRVVGTLAEICEMSGDESEDNWSPKTKETLGSLFCSWMPQTAATLDQRVKVLEVLYRSHPSLAWSICIGQLDGAITLGPNYRPRWRDDGQKSPQKNPEDERQESLRQAVDLLLNWNVFDEEMLGDVIERLPKFNKARQLRIWDLIGNWANSHPSDAAKASLRQRIQACARLRHEREESIAHPQKELQALKELLPNDLIPRHEWLFTSEWVDLPPVDAGDVEFDDDEIEQRLYEMRIRALRETWEERGYEGVTGLLKKNESTSDLIGELMAVILTARDDASEFFQSCLHPATACNSRAHRSCLTGFVRKSDADLVKALIDETERFNRPGQFTTFLMCMPFAVSTWRRLDGKPSDLREAYWKKVEPRTWRDSPTEEINESVGELLAVGRAIAAFRAAFVAWDRLETSLLIRLLKALPAAASDESRNNPMIDAHNISIVFDELDRRKGVNVEEKALLEYSYLEWLESSKHGIPNIEKHIAASPELFAQVIGYVYKRADGGEDPPGLWSGDLERQQEVARKAQILLNRIRYIPGTDKSGNIDAEELGGWIRAVRSWSERHDRALVGDHKIGALLARAPDEDGVWPCRAVCEALQLIESEEVGQGFIVGALNRRGVYMRGKGGEKEREHAEHYRRWSDELVYEYPYVADLLEHVARIYDKEAKMEDAESEIWQRFSL